MRSGWRPGMQRSCLNELAGMPQAQRWRIARKKAILLNDLIPTVIDFYNLQVVVAAA